MTAIEAERLGKTYGPTVALDDVSFTVEPGETVALLGANGAGKSTLVAILLGLRRHDTGHVTALGGSPAQAARAGRLGAMLQNGGLPDGVTVEEVLRLFCALYPHPLSTAEALAHAGIESLASRRLELLSGGQAQRVRFALAIVGNPELVFLDEPTAALDLEGRRDFWSFIRAWSDRGRTVIFASHHLDEVEAAADRVLLLQHGRLLADDTPAALRGALGAKAISFNTQGARAEALRSLPGVIDCDVRRGRVAMRSVDADATVAALYRSGIDVRDLEVTAPGLDAAILELTKEPA